LVITLIGANVHAKNKENNTPLVIAVKGDHTEIIMLLRKAGANLDIPKPKLGDMITNAAARGDIVRLESLSLAGASLNTQDTFGRTALHVAVEQDQPDVIQYIVKEIGITRNKHKLDVYKNSPIDIAIRLNREHLIDLLNQTSSKSHVIKPLFVRVKTL
jgi:ankyrin repeat protein